MLPVFAAMTVVSAWEGFATGVGLGLPVYRIARPHR